ncbi:MAG: hypothetical protein ACRDHZ_21260, partial [Ktedonobacteraceae bacterium]
MNNTFIAQQVCLDAIIPNPPHCFAVALFADLGAGLLYSNHRYGPTLDIEELYRDLLEEVYEPVRFGDLIYCRLQVLESVDSVAFNMGACEYADSLVEDGMLIDLTVLISGWPGSLIDRLWFCRVEVLGASKSLLNLGRQLLLDVSAEARDVQTIV